MEIKQLKEFIQKLLSGDRSKKEKMLVTISLGWILFIGYLTWWNGISSTSPNKSFRWDEWIWFGVVPAFVPYIFYFIWKQKSDE